MTVENGARTSRPLTMSCSISLGGIPVQANRMEINAKGQLVRAISQQITKVLCGRFSSPADVVSNSAELMGFGLALCESVRVADGELVLALIDGIMHFHFCSDHAPVDSDHDGDDPNPPGPDGRPRMSQAQASDFIEMVSSALLSTALSDESDETINRVLMFASSLLGTNVSPSSIDGDYQNLRNENPIVTISIDNTSMSENLVNRSELASIEMARDKSELHRPIVCPIATLLSEQSFLRDRNKLLRRPDLIAAAIGALLEKKRTARQVFPLHLHGNVSAIRHLALETREGPPSTQGLFGPSPTDRDMLLELMPLIGSSGGSLDASWKRQGSPS